MRQLHNVQLKDNISLCMQVKVSNTQFELRDLMSGQQVFKTRLYGAIVTTLVTRLLWVS